MNRGIKMTKRKKSSKKSKKDVTSVLAELGASFDKIGRRHGDPKWVSYLGLILCTFTLYKNGFKKTALLSIVQNTMKREKL